MIGYDSFEPFNQILATIGDIGDASQLMGEEWTENQFQKMSLIVAQGFTSKSYLAGMQQFVELFSGRPGQFNRIVASLLNNQIPLSGIRNEFGKLITPYTRELGSGIEDAIRNRNLSFEKFPGEDLPIKYDLLNGKTKWKLKYYLSKNNRVGGKKYNNTGANPWGGISFDTKRQILYLATGNPHSYYDGTLRPGDNLGASSINAIDIRNKKNFGLFKKLPMIFGIQICLPHQFLLQ